ncbi:MAG: ATP-binding cassette domain-containing protein [Planctomycetaceae bacterium]|jgi:ABC-type lipoprotein export system ATPase subunit|nr:ATP-binding cassette domain-containing protein [Planctomycetaceae bacterium]
MPNIPVLQIDGLEHTLYNRASKDTFTVYVDSLVSFHAGTFTSILGQSGCGKTTLLTVIGLLRKPTVPEKIKTFRILGEDIADLWKRNKNSKIEHLRRSSIGFALQNGELLPALTVAENIAVPLCLNGVSSGERKERVDELLAAFGIQHRKTARINKLSGGEYQRVVLARAIAHSPKIVFVDEPTSALNRERAVEALKELQKLGREKQTAVIMITHDVELAKQFSDQIIKMEPKGKSSGHIKQVVSRQQKSETQQTTKNV